MMSLLAPHNLPFAVALALMVLLALLQLTGLGDVTGEPDGDLGAGPGGGLADGLLVSLGIGRVPFMIWLAVFLLLFAGIGVGAQGLAAGTLGAVLDPWLAGALAAAGALPLTRVLVRPLAHILPGDETTAVSLDALVGRRARITTGRAAAGNPARAQVLDRHGQMHLVMVEPHDSGSEMLEGDEVLLVRRESETFYGVAMQERRLAPL